MSDGFTPDIFVFQPKSKPSAAGSIWKGGARERADDVLLFQGNKRTSEQSGLCSDVLGGFNLDIVAHLNFLLKLSYIKALCKKENSFHFPYFGGRSRK